MLSLLGLRWWSRKKPAATRPATDMLPITLVFGCARSGTSILGELIASHPNVAYIFEASPVWELAGHGPGGTHRLTAEHATPQAIRQIRGWFADQLRAAGPDKTLLVEKCPRNALRVPFLRKVFPEAKLIHIVRDGRDVACSLGPGIGGDEWNHLKPPSWQTFFAHATGAVRCAHAWKEVVEIALADLADVSHLQVRYERLVKTPAAEALRILQYLGLPDDPTPFQFARKIQNRTSGSYLAEHQHRWYRPDHAQRVGRWAENLTTEQQTEVHDLLSPLLERLGYE